MRNSSKVSEMMRERFEKTYRKAISNANQIYNKDKFHLLDLVPRTEQRVSKEYFKVNHIGVTWEAISREAFKYIKKEMLQHPDFLYYKEMIPFMTLKELESGRIGGKGFWVGDLEQTRYYIAFPTAQQKLFYTMLNDFNCREYAKNLDLEQLQKKSSTDLNLLFVDLYDMNNWNSLCETNGIEYAVDDGRFTSITAESARQLPILYRVEDRQKIIDIQKRLMDEMHCYVPSTRKAINNSMIESSDRNQVREELGMER